MLNKREVVMIIALAFLAGVIFTDFNRPKPIGAEVTNIVYDTLDAKIKTLSKKVDAINARVKKLESGSSRLDSDVKTLRLTVKKLSALQKDFSASITDIQKEIELLRGTPLKRNTSLKNN